MSENVVTLKSGSEVTQVIVTDTYRSATFRSNHEPFSYRFRDRWRFQSQIAKFSHPLVFCVPAEEVPLGIGYRRWGSKNE